MNHDLLSRNQRRKQRTRQQLKEAAGALLVEKGYLDLTIQDITDRLDLARATFYIHFRDKDEIIWAILQESFDELTATLAHELPKQINERHQKKLLRVFEYAAQNRALIRVIIGEHGHIGLSRRLGQYLAQVIQQDIESGLTQRVDAAVPTAFTAQFMAGAMIQVLTWWLEDPDAFTPKEVATLFYTLEMRPL